MDDYSSTKEIYEELSEFAKKMNVVIVTATQYRPQDAHVRAYHQAQFNKAMSKIPYPSSHVITLKKSPL